MKLKKGISFLIILLALSFSVNAMSLNILVKPLVNNVPVPNTPFLYRFDLTTDNTCINVVGQVNTTITTDNTGVGSTTLNFGNISSSAQYLCEYRNGNFRTVHAINGQLADTIIAKTIIADNLNITNLPYLKNNSAVDNHFPIFSNGQLIPSPLRYQNTDEESIDLLNNTIYFDITNGVGGLNLPMTESHKANWQVTNKIVDFIGTVSVTSYDPINDQTLITTLSGEGFKGRSGIDDASDFYVNGQKYFVNQLLDNNTLYLEGNVSFPNNSNYQIGIAPYIDVFGESTSERGYSISNSTGNWQWAMYIPHDANDEQMCFQNRRSPTGNLFCLHDNGDINAIGTVYATGLGLHMYAGMNTFNGITDNGDGSITIADENASLYSDSIGASPIVSYKIQGGRTGINFPPLVDGSINYVIVDYNGGTPAFTVTQDESQVNGLTSILFAQIVREGNTLNIINYDTAGNALAEKINSRLLQTERFVRENGLTLGETATRTVTITSGNTWHGSARTSHDAFSSNNETFIIYFHNGTTSYVELPITQYNNQQFDNGTDLVNLGTGNYTVNWIYRDQETIPKAYLLLGDEQYSLLSDALLAQPRSILPNEILYDSILVGRMIVQKDENTSNIGSAFIQTFSASLINDHSSLSNLQGGIAGQYYHLKLSDYTNVLNQVWLNKTDQRYNETALILAINASITASDNLKLDATDQRYNETSLILGINSTLQNNINNKLDITDQRYNETILILNTNQTTINKINTLNTSILANLSTKLDAVDQRYNDTLYFAEAYNTTQSTQTLGNANIYSNITGWNFNFATGFNVTNSGMINTKAGVYQFNIVLNEQVNAGDDMSIRALINGTVVSKSVQLLRHVANAPNQMNSEFIARFNVGDTLILQIADTSSNNKIVTWLNRDILAIRLIG